MKRFMICILFLAFLIPGIVSGYDNNITIGLNDIGGHWGGPVDMPILWESSTSIVAAINGFIMTTDGGMTAWFEVDQWYMDSISRDGSVPSALGWYVRYGSSIGDSIHPDKVFCAAAYMPPIPTSLMEGPLEPIFHIFISVEGSYGNIYIDSISEDPYHNWLWDDGSQNLNPTFNYDGSTHVIHYGSYFCGDANSDGMFNVSDAVFIINYIFCGGAYPDPIESADVNCDGRVNVSDAVWIQNTIFYDGKAPCDTDGDGVPDC